MVSLVAASLLFVAGCGKSSQQAGGGQQGPVEVGVYTVATQPVVLEKELPGRTSAFRVAEVRARVDGIVLERRFEEGSDVTQGQELYRIDPLPYEATLASARASLARAEATLESNRNLAERYKELVAANAVSKQEYDNALAAAKASEAEVAAGKAAVKAAEIDLGYTRVRSPIAGRIGRSEVTEGAYVQRGQATLMATVQQLDPIYVDLTQSSSEALALRRALESGKLQRSKEGEAKVKLILEDGTTYAHEGTLQFSDVTVEPSTGTITMRALFPNPDHELLPGMFVRARVQEGIDPEGILVPQIAVRRDAKGQASVMVVGAEEKVEVRPVVADRTVGNRWLVTEGLVAGDRIVVEGLQKVRPGSAVTTVPAKDDAVAQSASR